MSLEIPPSAPPGPPGSATVGQGGLSGPNVALPGDLAALFAMLLSQSADTEAVLPEKMPGAKTPGVTAISLTPDPASQDAADRGKVKTKDPTSPNPAVMALVNPPPLPALQPVPNAPPTVSAPVENPKVMDTAPAPVAGLMPAVLSGPGSELLSPHVDPADLVTAGSVPAAGPDPVAAFAAAPIAAHGAVPVAVATDTAAPYAAPAAAPATAPAAATLVANAAAGALPPVLLADALPPKIGKDRSQPAAAVTKTGTPAGPTTDMVAQNASVLPTAQIAPRLPNVLQNAAPPADNTGQAASVKSPAPFSAPVIMTAAVNALEPKREQSGDGNTGAPSSAMPQAPQVLTAAPANNAAQPMPVPDRAAMVHQVAESVRVLSLHQTPGGSGQMTLQLHPKEWGQVQVSVTLTPAAQTGGAPTQVVAHIVAESQSVKTALESQTSDLRHTLSEAGLHLDTMTVSVQNASAGNASGNAAQSGGQPGSNGSGQSFSNNNPGMQAQTGGFSNHAQQPFAGFAQQFSGGRQGNHSGRTTHAAPTVAFDSGAVTANNPRTIPHGRVDMHA